MRPGGQQKGPKGGQEAQRRVARRASGGRGEGHMANASKKQVEIPVDIETDSKYGSTYGICIYKYICGSIYAIAFGTKVA